MTIILKSPLEIAQDLAKAAREKRLAANLSQASLSKRSGVSLSVLKKFERTGKISLESLLKLALVLETIDEFSKLFSPKAPESFATLDALLQQKTRQRGRS